MSQMLCRTTSRQRIRRDSLQAVPIAVGVGFVLSLIVRQKKMAPDCPSSEALSQAPVEIPTSQSCEEVTVEKKNGFAFAI
jgi:hypothetical protein